ncbi:uncharacterized protein LOC128546910 [Mercenaria mercenaria]|uniref:uncharacterized protein LOC128546910 n=1 Tax=Mercenaria mercenaria TaxID=6596 RepID=UPI00234EE79D|nr:uncharacterized protein LOC128546910 [Mercenaria mercenaria]
MFGLYAGNQCTSMALTAIIQHKIYSEFTPRTINKILKEGNKLHTRLREDIVLSDNSDNRVAVEDFPHEDYIDIGKVFGRNTHVRMREPCRDVFTTGRDDFVDFLTIREYLESWYTMTYLRKMGFLLTIHAFSYAILISKNGVVLFDSHGHLKHKGEAIKPKAGAIIFPSTAELEEFLVGMYSSGDTPSLPRSASPIKRRPPNQIKWRERRRA